MNEQADHLDEDSGIDPVRDMAAENWDWFQYTEERGHRTYCDEATKCQRYYMGKGKQWDQALKDELNSKGKPTYEINELKPAVNIATGYQINNRMDAQLYPRGGQADEKEAEVKGKVLRQMMDNAQYKWRETEVFSDGLIQQRGYFLIDVDFDDNLNGGLSIEVPDPLDIRPDPDAKSYDPDDWGFFIHTRWQTFDWIEQMYGKEKRREASSFDNVSDDWGDLEDEQRSKFGLELGPNAYAGKGGMRHARIIDRQFWVYEMTPVLVSPEGDITVESSHQPDEIQQALQQGFIRVNRMMRRVRRVVSTSKVVLFDDYSPLDHFTLVPFFPFFRRGETAGMIDDGISPQDMLNKAISQYQHIINTTANSGYMVEQDSLANMTIDDLEDRGAETGLIIEYKSGKDKPEKIQPNQVPSGVDRFIDRALLGIRDVTGINESMLDPGKNQSGVAIQARQFIAQQQLAVPLDNLARTRYMVHVRALKIMQKFVTNEQVIRIVEKGIDGNDVFNPVVINKQMPDGSIANDMTLGKYDLIISEKPMAVTWENSEFEQVMAMIKAGIQLPDWVAIKHSNISDKAEVIKSQKDQQGQVDPVAEAEAELKRAQARLADVTATNKSVESMYSATTAANLIAATPAIAPLADSMLKSAGFKDQDSAPIVSAPSAPIAPQQIDQNTHPLSAPNPEAGLMATPQIPPAQ